MFLIVNRINEHISSPDSELNKHIKQHTASVTFTHFDEPEILVFACDWNLSVILKSL